MDDAEIQWKRVQTLAENAIEAAHRRGFIAGLKEALEMADRGELNRRTIAARISALEKGEG